jgi:hypothetical protein
MYDAMQRVKEMQTKKNKTKREASLLDMIMEIQSVPLKQQLTLDERML